MISFVYLVDQVEHPIGVKSLLRTNIGVVVVGTYIGITHNDDLWVGCNVHHENPQDLHIKVQT